MQHWEFEPEINRITAIEPGNCRVTIADKIYGINDRDWMANGKMMALAPRMAALAHLVLLMAPVGTNEKLLKEASHIIERLGGLEGK